MYQHLKEMVIAVDSRPYFDPYFGRGKDIGVPAETAAQGSAETAAQGFDFARNGHQKLGV